MVNVSIEITLLCNFVQHSDSLKDQNDYETTRDWFVSSDQTYFWKPRKMCLETCFFLTIYETTFYLPARTWWISVHFNSIPSLKIKCSINPVVKPNVKSHAFLRDFLVFCFLDQSSPNLAKGEKIVLTRKWDSGRKTTKFTEKTNKTDPRKNKRHALFFFRARSLSNELFQTSVLKILRIKIIE